MDAGKEKQEKGNEMSMSDKRIVSGGETVITISNEEASKANGDPKTVPAGSASSETSRWDKPPKIPTTHENLTRRRSLNRSVFSKPKSRFGEPAYHIDAAILEEDSLMQQEQFGRIPSYKDSLDRDSLDRGSPNNNSASSIRTNSIIPKTMSIVSRDAPEEGEDEEEIYKRIELSKEKTKKRVGARVVIERVAFVCVLACLVACFTVEKLEKTMMWGLELWKWCVLLMVIFSGMLVTNWFMHLVVFLIEWNFLLRKKVLYFVHGMKKSVQVFIWIGLVLLTWIFLFDQGVERSKTATKILNSVTSTLISLLIASFLWLLKTLLLKLLACSFHVQTFFDRIQESVFYQYVLQTLSGPPLIEEAMKVGRVPSTGQLSFRTWKKGKRAKDKKVIDMVQVHQMKQEKVSASTMKILIDAVTNSGLSTISNTLDESIDGSAGEHDLEITNEMEATAAAYQIFRNVAQPGSKFIEEDDLLRFMIKEEVDLVFPLFVGSEAGRINSKSLTDWVIKVYNGRKALAHALNDTKTAVKQLNKLVTGILIFASILIWLLLMEIATTNVLVLLFSQFIAMAFLLGNTCRTLLESIIFVFVMHPFDVGDRCVIDGVPLLVEEMNLLTTIFLKLDNEKVYYPNAILATKPISNYFRSPDMGDNVGFSIDFATPVEKIALLKDRIKKYLERNPQHWHPGHNVVVKEIENVNKLKMVLYFTHTITYQEFPERNRRRTELTLEIKKMFEELDIKYHLPPQQVHLSHINSQNQQHM